MRVQPLLDWTEVDIWRYIQREKIPIPSLYLARDGKRFRSLGCHPITHPIASNAATIEEIIAELEGARTSERAAAPRITMSPTPCRSCGPEASCESGKRKAGTRNWNSAPQNRFRRSCRPRKSTLIGRILTETGSLPDGKIESLRKACSAQGQPFEYAFVLDALSEEQEQNITIDTTQIQFRSARRDYVIIDAPGHQEFLKNMITGAANADAAVVVIAADEGVREQSRRHGQLLSLLGIHEVIVAVNKMDSVEFAEDRFRQIEKEYAAFLQDLGFTARVFIPLSASSGENVATDGGSAMPWFRGLT